MRFFRLVLLPALLAATARAAPPLALGDNERLVYHVSWAVLPSVGVIDVTAHAETDPAGTKLLRIVTDTRTRGVASLLLPFEARAESLFDVATGRLVWLGESSDKRGQSAAHDSQGRHAHSRNMKFLLGRHMCFGRPLKGIDHEFLGFTVHGF